MAQTQTKPTRPKKTGTSAKTRRPSKMHPAEAFVEKMKRRPVEEQREVARLMEEAGR